MYGSPPLQLVVSAAVSAAVSAVVAVSVVASAVVAAASQQSPSLAALLYVGFRGGRQQVAAFVAGHEKIPETSTRSPGYVFRVAPD